MDKRRFFICKRTLLKGVLIIAYAIMVPNLKGGSITRRNSRSLHSILQDNSGMFYTDVIPKAGIDKRLKQTASPLYQQRLDLPFIENLHDLRQDILTEIQHLIIYICLPETFCRNLFRKDQCRCRTVKQFQLPGQGQFPVNHQPERIRSVSVPGGQ